MQKNATLRSKYTFMVRNSNFHSFSLKEFGQRLKSTRTQNGITQDELADRLDISKRTLLEIEAGRSELSLTNLFKVSEELKVSVHFLLGINEGNIVNSFNSIQQEANAQQGVYPTYITLDREWSNEINKRFVFLEEQIRKKDEIIDRMRSVNTAS